MTPIMITKVEQLALLYQGVQIRFGRNDRRSRYLSTNEDGAHFAVDDGGASEITQELIDECDFILAIHEYDNAI